MSQIIRPQTPLEKDMTPTGLDGNSTGFISLVDVTKEKKEVSKDIRERNRAMIINSDNILKEINNLSCSDCYDIENNHNLVENMTFKQIFMKYVGRLKLDKIIFRKQKHRLSNDMDVSLTIRCHRCGYCGKKISISFSDFELSKEKFKELKKSSEVDDKIDLEKW